jgi:hypothetical protein
MSLFLVLMPQQLVRMGVTLFSNGHMEIVMATWCLVTECYCTFCEITPLSNSVLNYTVAGGSNSSPTGLRQRPYLDGDLAAR